MISDLVRSPYIYHYTNVEALFAILGGYRNPKDKKPDYLNFWAWNIFNMNDKTEMEVGYDYIKDYLPQYEEHEGIPKEKRLSEVYENTEDEKTCKEDFLKYKNQESIDVGVVPYVICFTKKRDFLPMWTLYGNMGKGVCLKFDVNRLLDGLLTNRGERATFIGSVAYDPETALTTLDEMIPLAYCLLTSSSYSNTKNKPHQLAELCYCLSPFFKSKDFEYEQEARIVINVLCGFDEKPLKAPFKYPSPQSTIEPHVDFPICPSALNEVIIGPNAHSKVLEHIIDLEKRDCKLSFDITYSEIPFIKK